MKNIIEKLSPVPRPEKVLQFGEGNFLRAFVDWQIDIANEKTDFNGNVVLVQPLEQGMGDAINAQKGLYTTLLRGIRKGKTVEEFRPVTSISRCLNPYTHYEEYLRCAENPDLRFVVSNTTEAGIAYHAEDRLSDRPPRSFPGKVTAFLFRRFEHFKGDPAKALVFIPCELIDKNGDKLKEIVETYAREWNLGGAFLAWLGSCDFCNSLVDRIVPGYPREEAGALCEKLGYEDPLLVAAELFHLWVIEGAKDHRAELPLAEAGLNVIWTADMSFYRTRKVRILNGAHTSGVLAAYLYGLDTVEQCIRDPLINKMMKKAVFEEIIPSMEGGAAEGGLAEGGPASLTEYANDVFERFANPYIKHLLLSISLNSVSKFKTRVLPSLLDRLVKTGKPPEVLSFSLAALIAFYNGTNPAGRMLTGSRNGVPYPIQDDEGIVKRFAALYAETAGSETEKARRITRAVLGSVDWWGEDLSAYGGLEDAVGADLAAIRRSGIKSVIEGLV
ncbi:MAG: tagaturonate reductase [Spirochaetaceae bacterium]|jgi:tagaturonate reductase|nr:tagaturonate reductase [Spirochaetaceae bacterium]